MKKLLVIWIFLVSCISVHATDKKAEMPKKKTICLNMIVKNESKAIEKCLNSCKPIIDYWVIQDNGSTDGTQEIIKACMKGIPGELVETKWVDFATNRNEALKAAKNKADYLLFMDADEMLIYDKDFKLPDDLDKDFYHMIVRQTDAVNFRRPALVKNSLDWSWSGVLHEAIGSSQAKTIGTLRGVMNVCDTSVGGRSEVSKQEKYLKDAAVLEEALKKEPNNARYMFYLAQSYFAADALEPALKWYQKRAETPSDDYEETFRAIYNLGSVQEKQNRYDEAIENFWKAYYFRPFRAEPLFRAAVLYRKKGNLLLGYLLSKHALTMPYPDFDACVEYLPYEYATLVEFANCALLLGKFDEGLDACIKLLANSNLPQDIRPQVISNFNLAQTKVNEKALYSKELVSKEPEKKQP